MIQKRTDLAMEARELLEESGRLSALKGVRARDYESQGFPVTSVEVLDEEGAKELGKPQGRYVTLTLTGLFQREEDAFPRACRALAEVLRPMIGENASETALAVGLGNAKITPDAVGPLAMEYVMVTRHMIEQMPQYFEGFRPVAAVVPGVLGSTGMESSELVRGAVAHVKPAAVLVVDALASRRLSRVCATVQVSDAGIVPGSGVGNSRAAFSKESLGVPVVAIGMPTVVDAATLAADLMEEAGYRDVDPAALSGHGGEMIVTPREIDTRVADMAKVIGYGINLALHPDLEIEDIDMFLS